MTATIDLTTARDGFAAPCKGFPAEFESHSFPATIELRDRALELYDVSVDNRPKGSGFWLSRVGRFLLFEIEHGLFEDMPGFRYLMISGISTTTEPPSDSGTSISVPFSATFQYCQLKFERGIYHVCSQAPPEHIAAFHSCTSDHATMTFTKR